MPLFAIDLQHRGVKVYHKSFTGDILVPAEKMEAFLLVRDPGDATWRCLIAVEAGACESLPSIAETPTAKWQARATWELTRFMGKLCDKPALFLKPPRLSKARLEVSFFRWDQELLEHATPIDELTYDAFVGKTTDDGGMVKRRLEAEGHIGWRKKRYPG